MRVCCLIPLLVYSCAAHCAEPIDAVIPVPTQITLSSGYSPKDGPTSVKLDAGRSELGEEGYVLTCDRKGYLITAATDAGVRHAKTTLALMKSVGSIRCCMITDKPRMKMRAVMLDLARCTEKHDYYRDVIDMLARWKINAVFLHLTDDQGCALEIKKYPALAGAYAFTQDEMKRLVNHAAERGIELIPEIESWGHAAYLTRLPELADLAESSEHRGDLCTSNPKTWQVLGDIYREVAAIFPSEYLHAGCDEAYMGYCPQCKAKAESGGKHALVAEHLSRVAEAVKACGKRPVVWGDALVSETNRPAADAIPKDLIICHWVYSPEVAAEPVQFLRTKGFEVIGSSAIVWGGRLIRPAVEAFDNVRSFTKVILESKCLGMQTTIWYPQREIADTLPFALAYAAEQSWSGDVRSRIDFAKAFAPNYFGFAATTEFAQALWNLHEQSTRTTTVSESLWNDRASLDQLATRETAQTIMPNRERAKAVANQLRRYREQVKSHLAEYDALILAADTIAYLGDRAVGAYLLSYHVTTAKGQAALGENAAAGKELRAAVELLDGLSQSEADLNRRLGEAWDRWRYPDDPNKTTGGQSLTAYFQGADAYMKMIRSRLAAATVQLGAGESVNWDGVF